jgi:hypothetical protein
LLSFVAFLVALRFLVSPLVFVFFVYFLVQKALNKDVQHAIKRHSSGFWYPLSMFHLEAVLFVSLLPLLPNFLNQLVFYPIPPSQGFLKAFGSKVIEMP